MDIVVVNDDGYSSPLIQPLLQIASKFGRVILAAPAREQSWKGKSMSREGLVRVEQVSLVVPEMKGPQGAAEFPEITVDGFSIDGTPADCVNLAVHHLLERKPDLILSGINAGNNAGVGYAMSSGTVGGAWEANIQGIPAIAFSQEMTVADWKEWKTEGTISRVASYYGMANLDTDAGRFGVFLPLLLQIVRRKFEEIGAQAVSGSEIPSTWNVNLPSQPKEECRLVEAPQARDRTGSLFSPDSHEDNAYFFQLHFDQLVHDPRDHCDRAVMRDGDISICKMNLGAFAQQ